MMKKILMFILLFPVLVFADQGPISVTKFAPSTANEGGSGVATDPYLFYTRTLEFKGTIQGSVNLSEFTFLPSIHMVRGPCDFVADFGRHNTPEYNVTEVTKKRSVVHALPGIFYCNVKYTHPDSGNKKFGSNSNRVYYLIQTPPFGSTATGDYKAQVLATDPPVVDLEMENCWGGSGSRNNPYLWDPDEESIDFNISGSSDDESLNGCIWKYSYHNRDGYPIYASTNFMPSSSCGDWDDSEYCLSMDKEHCHSAGEEAAWLLYDKLGQTQRIRMKCGTYTSQEVKDYERGNPPKDFTLLISLFDADGRANALNKPYTYIRMQEEGASPPSGPKLQVNANLTLYTVDDSVQTYKIKNAGDATMIW